MMVDAAWPHQLFVGLGFGWTGCLLICGRFPVRDTDQIRIHNAHFYSQVTVITTL